MPTDAEMFAPIKLPRLPKLSAHQLATLRYAMRRPNGITDTTLLQFAFTRTRIVGMATLRRLASLRLVRPHGQYLRFSTLCVDV